MKKKLLLLILLFIPFIAKASQIDELKLKWTESIKNDGYIYNPYYEADEKYFNSGESAGYDFNKSKILELDDGYIIFGNNSISKYDRNSGLEKHLEYDYMSYFIEDDTIYIVSNNYEKELTKVEILDNNLKRLKTYTENDFYLRSMFIENDNLVFTGFEVNDESGYYFTSVVLNKKTLEKEKESTIYTPEYVYIEDHKVFSSNTDYIYLDEDYDLIPQTLLNNNTYTMIYYSTLYTYKADGTIVKSIDLSPSSYLVYDIKQIVSNNKIYVGVQEYLYNSTTKKYNHRTTYYLYDENLNLLDSHEITAPENSSIYNYSLTMYQNKNGIFTQYASQNFKIDENFEFTETDEKKLYNENNLPFSEKVEINKNLQAIEYSEYVIRNLKYELLEKLEEEYDDVYVEPTYDIHYNEEKDEMTIIVTWHMEIWSSHYEYQSLTELIILNEETNFEPTKRITILEEKPYEYYYGINTVINVTDDYIIIGVTNGGETKILFYNHEYNLIKEFKTQETDDYSIQKIDYKEGRLLLVYTEPRRAPSSIAHGVIDVNKEKMTITSSPLKEIPESKTGVERLQHNGLYSAGEKMIVEYYEIPFNIITKTDGNGTITATKEQAESGDAIKFEVKAKEGYVLGEVKVTDKNGNTVIFTDYTFTMPSSDVIIEATFIKEAKNPDTSDILVIFFVITSIISIGLVINNKKKLDWIK